MKFRALALSVLASAAIAFTAAQAAMWEWSKSSSNNANADPSINWSEGMSPSSVNDSARAMMARVAEYRDDISGAIVTTGTASAYSLTSNEGFDATPVTGQLLAFTPHVTNGNAPTLTVDGGNTFPIQSPPGNAIGAATLVEGTPYTLKFTGTAWVLRNFYGNPYSVPLGGLMPYTGTTAPNSSFVMPYGQCISRTTYAAYFAQVGTKFGACDGTTTFGVPDLRGRTIAAPDNMGGSTANRLTTTYFGADPTVFGNAGGQQNQLVLQANFPAITLTTNIAAGQGSHSHAYSNAFPQNQTAAGGNPPSMGQNTGFTSAATLPAMTGTTPLGGSGTPLATVQPTILINYILRVI